MVIFDAIMLPCRLKRDHNIVGEIEYISTLINCNQTTKCCFQCVHVDLSICSSDIIVKVIEKSTKEATKPPPSHTPFPIVLNEKNKWTTKMNTLNVICVALNCSILQSPDGGPYLNHTCIISGHYIKCSESSRLSLLQHACHCTRVLCTLFQYHKATMLLLFTMWFQGENYNERAKYKDVLTA